MSGESNVARRSLWVALALGSLLTQGRLIPIIRNASFHMDIWEMIKHGRHLSTLARYEWSNIKAGGDLRFRPVMHVAVAAWVALHGLDAAGFAAVLWAMALGMNALGALLLRRLGFGTATAVCAAVFMAFSSGDIATLIAHQYNDLMFANLFVVATLFLLLRDKPAAPLLVAALLCLGLLSHESAAMCAPLLVLCDWFRGGTAALRRLPSDRNRIVVLALSTVFVLWRVMTLHHSSGGSLFGLTKLIGNIGWLFSSVVGEFVALIAIAALLIVGQAARLPAKASTAFAVGWLVFAYAPFLLNQQYQSSTYLNLALLVPAAWVIDPIVGWLLSEARPSLAQRVGPYAFAVMLFPLSLGDSLGKVRSDTLVLNEILAHTKGRSGPQDVWLVESVNEPQRLRLPMADQIAIYEPDESIAASEFAPDRKIRMHDVTPEVFAYARPRPGDLVIATKTESGIITAWERDERTGNLIPLSVADVAIVPPILPNASPKRQGPE